jgi:DNA segregation ATPase FtsK/SpoIIIE, S-DNA-T family
VNFHGKPRATGQELRWWLRRGRRFARRTPGCALSLVAIVWLTAPRSLLWVGIWIGLLVTLRVWSVRAPLSFSRITGPLLGRWHLFRIRWHWRAVSEGCGLAVLPPASRRPEDSQRRPRLLIPRVVSSKAAWPHLELVVRPQLGQTMQTFEQAAEATRVAVGASRLRVEPHGVQGVRLILTVGDELRTPFEATVGDVASGLSSVALGRREDGRPWLLAIGPQTLVAGCSGSGKGSVFWSFAFGLAPAVREGRVRLHGIDLKGGMEIRMGDPLFTTTATNASEAVASLEMLVGWMQERTRAYAGRVRSHEATVSEPLHVVMIDELAALTAYCPERDLQRRAEAAINLLCSQGRAPGFMVFACLQDPRKEVIPSRGLFTQMVGLRLKDLSETAMVLGETAVESGAWCHRITRNVPGTGFVLPEDGTHPVRVRAGFASDDLIRSVAREYATASRVTLVLPEGEHHLSRSKRPRASEAA